MTQEELEEMNHTLSKGSRKNQSINHITSYAGDAFPVVGRTVYNYVNNGLFPDVKRIDLPKAVRYSKRKKEKPRRVEENREIYKGRTYADYAIRVNEDPSVPTVQMDTVEGIKGQNQKVLFTLEIVEIKFDDEKTAYYDYTELEQIEHSYAITIHKAQRKRI